MDKRRRWMVGLAGFGTILMVLLGVGIYAINRLYDALIADFCAVTLHRALASPDGRRALVSFDVDCGATTPFNTQISLIPEGASFSREKYPPFFVVGGRHDLLFHWRSNDEVEVEVPPGEQIARRQAAANGITVKYKY